MIKMYMQQIKPKRIPMTEIISHTFEPQHEKSDWITFESLEEEIEIYDECLSRMLNNMSYYLDKLDTLKEFGVSWLNYGSKPKCAELNRNYAISHPYNCDKTEPL